MPFSVSWHGFLGMQLVVLPGWTNARLLKEIIDHKPAWLTDFLSARCQLCQRALAGGPAFLETIAKCGLVLSQPVALYFHFYLFFLGE